MRCPLETRSGKKMSFASLEDKLRRPRERPMLLSRDRLARTTWPTSSDVGLGPVKTRAVT